MNSQNQRRFTSDEIIDALFDTTTAPAKAGLLERVFQRFGKHAADTTERQVTLNEAVVKLVRSGMNVSEALDLQDGVIAIMTHNIDSVYTLAKAKTTPVDFPEEIGLRVRWSPDHFLGTHIYDPKTEISQNPEMMTRLKSLLKRELDAHMRRNPTAFYKKAALSGEPQLVAGRA